MSALSPEGRDESEQPRHGRLERRANELAEAPVVEEALESQVTKLQAAMVEVHGEGSFRLDGKQHDIESLKKVLQDRAQSGKADIARFRFHQKLSRDRVFSLMKLAKAAGVIETEEDDKK